MEARLAQLDRASASGAEGGTGRRPAKKGDKPNLKLRRLARGATWLKDRCAACGSDVVWAPFVRGGSVALHPFPEPGGKYCLPLAHGNLRVHDVRQGESQPVYSLRYAPHREFCGVFK